MTKFEDLVKIISQEQIIGVRDYLSHRIIFDGLLRDLPYFTFEKIFNYEVLDMFVSCDGRTLFIEVNK